MASSIPGKAPTISCIMLLLNLTASPPATEIKL